jgi:hypothetical protein
MSMPIIMCKDAFIVFLLVLNLIHSFFSFFFVFANLHLSSLHLYIYCLSSLLVYFFHLCILTFYFVFTNQRLSSLCFYVCCLCMSIFFMFACSLSLLCLQICIFPLCNDTIKPACEHELVRMSLWIGMDISRIFLKYPYAM